MRRLGISPGETLVAEGIRCRCDALEGSWACMACVRAPDIRPAPPCRLVAEMFAASRSKAGSIPIDSLFNSTASTADPN